jgi:hypothetical protein
MSPGRRQDTQFVGKVSTVEREHNPILKSYGNGPGIRQDVERYMPVPYDLFLKLDVWTPNITTKLQIFEQIAVIFNPSIQLQQNSNLLDWTSIFEVFLEDYTFTSRSIPQGGTDDRDVMSFKFKLPIWINPPAKLKRSSLVAEIVSNVFYSGNVNSTRASIQGDYDPFRTCIDDAPVQIITTEGNYKVSVEKQGSTDIVTLLSQYGESSTELNWFSLIQKYGQITPNITKLRLKLDPNIDISDGDIIGNIYVDSDNPNRLFFTVDIDTLPASTLPPIYDIIDPTEVWPGNHLPMAAPGQRYLLTSSDSAGEEPAIPPGVETSPWGSNIVAYPNDIIEYNGVYWTVIFDAKISFGKNYVINNANSSQYVFDSETQAWAYTYYGEYSPGYWRIDGIMSAAEDQGLDNIG